MTEEATHLTVCRTEEKVSQVKMYPSKALTHVTYSLCVRVCFHLFRVNTRVEFNFLRKCQNVSKRDNHFIFH